MKQQQLLDKIDDALGDLEKDLSAGKSEKLLSYLRFLGNFHHYSLGNLMLILSQNPNASHVAGFHRWLKLHRFVKKGEKGIKIMAPLIRKTESKSKGQPEKKVIFGFKAVTVFDISQTDGEELPELGGYKGDTGNHLQSLEDFAATKEIQVIWEKPDGGAVGVSRGGTVMVDPEMAPAEKFATLVHELAHELLHRGQRSKGIGKAIKETEAEAVAYAVCSAVGVSGKEFSSDYIQLHQGEAEKLKASLEHIRLASSEILRALLVEASDCKVSA